MCGNMNQRRMVLLQKNLAQKSLLRQISNGGDYWTRTSDLLRMKNCVAVAINLGVVFSTSGCFIYAIAQASSSLFRALK